MDVLPPRGQTPRPLDRRSTAEAPVGDPLTRRVSLYFEVVAHLRLQSQVPHRPLPMRPVVGGLRSVAGDGQEVGVFVPKGLQNRRLILQHVGRKADGSLSVVRHSRRHAVRLPVQDRRIAEGEGGDEMGELLNRGRPKFGSDGRLFGRSMRGQVLVAAPAETHATRHARAAG